MLTHALRLPALRVPTLDARQWLTSLVLAMVFIINVLAGISILGFAPPTGRALAKASTAVPQLSGAKALPAPEPLQFREMAPLDAVAHNASIPLSTTPNPPARPFIISAATEADKQRAIECLTSAIYYEAATEPLEGQKAVAQVVLNRVRHPAYPNSVCGVVFQGSERRTGCQFTFTCDGALARTPIPSLWKQARQLAEAALAGSVHKPVGWATHYHTNWVVPYWSPSLVKAANVGTHIFYRWTGGWGTGPAFRNRYAGTEAEVAKLRHLSSVPPETEAAEQAELTPEEGMLAGVAMGGVTTEAAPTAAGPAERVILRRYEPARAEGVANVLAAQTPRGETVPSSLRWALTGDSGKEAQPALGAKPEAKAEHATAKPAAPKELEGVRKVGEVAGPAR